MQENECLAGILSCFCGPHNDKEKKVAWNVKWGKNLMKILKLLHFNFAIYKA